MIEREKFAASVLANSWICSPLLDVVVFSTITDWPRGDASETPPSKCVQESWGHNPVPKFFDVSIATTVAISKSFRLGCFQIPSSPCPLPFAPRKNFLRRFSTILPGSFSTYSLNVAFLRVLSSHLVSSRSGSLSEGVSPVSTAAFPVVNTNH